MMTSANFCFSYKTKRLTRNPGTALERREPDLAGPGDQSVGHPGEEGDEELVRVHPSRASLWQHLQTGVGQHGPCLASGELDLLPSATIKF